MRYPFILFLLVLSARPAFAQNESKLAADFRGEGERYRQSCEKFNLSSVLSCADLLFTDHPLHIAVGSIAPEDGFGAGAAFVTHYTPNDSWRLSLDADAIGSSNASWRAGVYLKAIYTGSKTISVQNGRPARTPPPESGALRAPYFNGYVQAISLNKIDFFGIGPNSTEAGRTFFGMREIISGISAVLPVPQAKWLNLSLNGEANGRFVVLYPSEGQSSPSIGDVYTDATAPGLTSTPAFAQLGEGVRIEPAFGEHFRLNYALSIQEFVSAASSHFTFSRLVLDLSHEIPIYTSTRDLSPRVANGPDDCSKSAEERECPRVSRNREGAIELRFLVSESIVPEGDVVPFYFDPTLGGGDINGNLSLASYQDYRFRAPNQMLAHEAFEHSIGSLPVGFVLGADEGTVALTPSDLVRSRWLHSFSGGLTLRAGGFPQVYLLFAWGGKEGTHTIANVNTSLLQAGGRPSLD